jgi:hypothetical protein
MVTKQVARRFRAQLRQLGLFVEAPAWGEGLAAIEVRSDSDVDAALEILGQVQHLDIVKITATRIFVDAV